MDDKRAKGRCSSSNSWVQEEDEEGECPSWMVVLVMMDEWNWWMCLAL